MNPVHFVVLLLVLWMSGANASAPPQSYTTLDMPPFRVPKGGAIACPTGWRGEAEWLAQYLSRRGGRWIVVGQGVTEAEMASITLQPIDGGTDFPYAPGDKRLEEAYSIRIGESVSLHAGGEAGARYAVRRFAEMLGENAALPAARVIDYPDFAWRGAVLVLSALPCGDPVRIASGGESRWLRCMERELDELAGLRLNLLGLISPIFNRLNESDMRLLESLFGMARERNLEPMPVLDTKLWGTPKESINVDAIEGIFHEEIPYRATNGELVRAGTPVPGNYIWDLDGDASRPRERAALSWSRIWSPGDRNRRQGLAGGEWVARMERAEDPWRNALRVEFPEMGRLLKVTPGEYYELGVRLRSDGNRSARLIAGVEEYDQDKKLITGLNHYSVGLDGVADWKIHWIPHFTSRRTRYLSIRLAPVNLASAPAWVAVSDLELRPMRGELVNVLDNAETTVRVTSSDGARTYGRGDDFSVELPEVREWRDTSFEDIERARLRLSPGSRILEGETVRVSFDSLPLVYRTIPRSKYSAVSRYTYLEYRRLFLQLKRLRPVFVHLSFDEHMGGLNRDSRSRKLGMNNRDLLVTYINTLAALNRAEDDVRLPDGGEMPGVGNRFSRLVIWDDMVNPWHNGGLALYQVPFGGVEGKTQLERGSTRGAALDRGITLASWWYRNEDENGIAKNTPRFYRELGYAYFATAWYQRGGIRNWLASIEPESCEGVLAAAWDGNTAGVEAIACSGWNYASSGACLKSGSP